tara:strand:- start:913 stop:2118 length:1206 start_codon:yes stop_codon:yes gene_type:complete
MEKYNLTNLTASNLDIEKLRKLNSLEIFSSIACSWLSDLSRFLLKDPKTKKYPDVATFAFFCRKANLSKLKSNHCNPSEIRIGKGIAFHVAPSNVPVNFAYTLITGLLAGNINIIKIPSKHFEQIDIIINAINKTLTKAEFNEIKERIFIIKYDTDSDVTTIISKICDLRIIWGGNETVSNIKNIITNPKSLDISFPDRYSISLIDAKSYLGLENKLRLSELFFNDTYLFDQNACTAPHSLFWVGNEEDIERSKKIFWDLLEKTIIEKQYNLNDISTIDKLVTFYSQSMDEVPISKINKNNLIWRVNNKEFNSKVDNFRCASGYFNEFNINHINELKNIIKKNYQTLSYYGIHKNDLINFFKTNKPLGIDRVVPIGNTLDFSLNWDGYDLINQMSRIIEIN